MTSRSGLRESPTREAWLTFSLTDGERRTPEYFRRISSHRSITSAHEAGTRQHLETCQGCLPCVEAVSRQQSINRVRRQVPRQNRVTPFGSITATSARGTLTGNRGCLHDDRQNIRRQFQRTRWIICLLDFKGRKRNLMTPGHYTELFFLDEATALAAGHRPCAESQRERFTRFRDLWATANPALAGTSHPAAAVMDAAIHQERTLPVDHGNRSCRSIGNMPDGVFVTDDGRTAYLILAGRLRRWSPSGYEVPTAPLQSPVQVLTPASIVRTIAAGYAADIHRSAIL
jgi:hypothetical protein